MPIRYLGEQDVDHLERGTALLGSGGGGQTGLPALLLRRGLAGRRVALLDREDLPGGHVVPIGLVGAVSVFTERLPSGGEWTRVLTAIVERTRVRCDGLISVEAGGGNGIIVFVAAAELGLPVLDADLTGRGLPRLDQTSMAALGEPLTPLAIGTADGRLLVLDGLPPSAAERIVRAALSEFGGWAAIALRPVPVTALDRVAIPGSLTYALRLGARHAACARGAAPYEMAGSLGGRVLATGRVLEVVRDHATAGFGRGSVIIRADRGGTLLRLEMENEYLLALSDGEPVASTPDILCVLDRVTGEPIFCDTVRAGAEVVALHLPGPPFWWRPEVVAAVAPRAFGLDLDPVARP
ncbi:hypothetical protein HNP84_010201 [Thermocatellispora tengchongensis]|uniref:DUF917 domain-containing protein n=1 Tax=Thermocatellispora tengchongensis TaxID=1073253 RepID=A0A840PG98_9ACTN|nr:DUF917 domain-containing protein [Thermocatellispora tengchongensis]MBB5140434.1 hypothetical protein [Thermocatellispora tengchongensis]